MTSKSWFHQVSPLVTSCTSPDLFLPTRLNTKLSWMLHCIALHCIALDATQAKQLLPKQRSAHQHWHQCFSLKDKKQNTKFQMYTEFKPFFRLAFSLSLKIYPKMLIFYYHCIVFSKYILNIFFFNFLLKWVTLFIADRLMWKKSKLSGENVAFNHFSPARDWDVYPFRSNALQWSIDQDQKWKECLSRFFGRLIFCPIKSI